MKWIGHVAWERRRMHRTFFVGKPEGNKPLGRPGCR
jgi:hypothetical protein